MEAILDFLAKVFFLDKPVDTLGAQITRYFGAGLTGLWFVLVLVRYIATQEVFVLFLGLVTVLAWIMLWRIAFLIAASLFRW
jgi:hypothetical protein